MFFLYLLSFSHCQLRCMTFLALGYCNKFLKISLPLNLPTSSLFSILQNSVLLKIFWCSQMKSKCARRNTYNMSPSSSAVALLQAFITPALLNFPQFLKHTINVRFGVLFFLKRMPFSLHCSVHPLRLWFLQETFLASSVSDSTSNFCPSLCLQYIIFLLLHSASLVYYCIYYPIVSSLKLKTTSVCSCTRQPSSKGNPYDYYK